MTKIFVLSKVNHLSVTAIETPVRVAGAPVNFNMLSMKFNKTPMKENETPLRQTETSIEQTQDDPSSKNLKAFFGQGYLRWSCAKHFRTNERFLKNYQHT